MGTLDHTRTPPFLLVVTRLVFKAGGSVTFENHISSLAQLRVS